MWERYAEKQDGSEGWMRAQERCEMEGWAREVIGEIMGLIVAGRGDVVGRRMGEMKGLEDVSIRT